MINSLCGSVGSIKSENSCTTKLQQANSSNESSVSESNKKKFPVQSTSCSDMEQSSLIPPSLNFPSLKFDLDGDLEVQSPDNSSLWESLFSDQFETDFMVLSPVRNLPSPQASTYNYNYNYAHAMQGQSLSGCSPPRIASQLGPFSSLHQKGKGLSPLHRVFNSPSHNNQCMQSENAALQAIEDFLEDYQRDGFVLGAYSNNNDSAAAPPSSSAGGTKLLAAGDSSQSYDLPTTIPAMSDCLSVAPNPSLRFCGSAAASETSSCTPGSSQLTPESAFDMESILSQQLQQDRQQDDNNNNPQQQQQQQLQQPHLHPSLSHGLMAPLPIGYEQVRKFSNILWIFLTLKVRIT